MSGVPQNMTTTRRTGVALAIRIASAAIAYGAQILLARWLGLEQYGVFTAIWTWLLVAGSAMPLGLNVAILSSLPRYAASGEHGLARGLMLTAVTVASGAAAIAAGAGITLVTVLPGLGDHAAASLAVLGLLCLPLLATSEVLEGIGRAHGWMGPALIPIYLLRPLVMLAAAATVVASGGALDAGAVLLCAIGACAVTCLAQAAWLARWVLRTHTGNDVLLRPRTWLVLALPMLVTEVGDVLMGSLDLIVVAALLGPEDAGRYFALQRTIGLVAFVLFAVAAASTGPIALAAARMGRDDAARATLQREVRIAATLTFWPTLLGATALVALNPVILSLFGPQFAPSPLMAGILALGFVARSIVGPADVVFNVVGAQRACAAILTANVVVAIASTTALVATFGATGGAFAAALTLGGLAASYAVYARTVLGLTLLPLSPIAAIAAVRARFDGGAAASAAHAPALQEPRVAHP